MRQTGEESKEVALNALASYVTALIESADSTQTPEDRRLYELHLAQAARMFVAIHSDAVGAELTRLLEEERHNYGWSYLSGEQGDRAEQAFASFLRIVSRRGE